MERIKTISYFCSIDKSMQKAKCFVAEGESPRPLLVALHTWSYTYEQDCTAYAKFCLENNWNFIFPDFRGPNWTADACGSDKVVEDIADAVAYMKCAANVDNSRVYLMGGSGGGHCSLLLASRHPELWTAVSAWCPISDLKKWCTFHGNKSYGAQIIRNLKGDPRSNEAAARDAARRSPVTWLANAKNVAVDIGTGIHDGHTGSVPISEAFNAYNCVAAPADKVAEKDIDFMVKNEKAPAGTPEFKDPGYGKRKIHYRKTSGNVRITIFEGGHHILSAYGVAWLLKQKKGQKAVWQSTKGSGKSEKLTR